MNTFCPCDFTDCLIHPNYEEFKPEIEPASDHVKKTMDSFHTWNSGSAKSLTGDFHIDVSAIDPKAYIKDAVKWSEAIDSEKFSSMLFKVGDLDISLECLVCKHLNKIDMREKLIVDRAKKKLQGDNNG